MNKLWLSALGLVVCAASASAIAREPAAWGGESRDEARSERSRAADHGDRGDRGRSSRNEPAAQSGAWGGAERGGSNSRGSSRSSGPSGFQGYAVEPRPDNRRQYGGDDSRFQRDSNRSDSRREASRDARYNGQNYGPQGGNRYDSRHDNRYSGGGNDYRYGDRHDNRRYDRHDRHDGYGSNYGGRGWRHADWRRSWNHGWGGQRYRTSVRYYYPSGYRSQRWSIGYSLPLAFLINSYYVDYRPYGLSAPPYGCRWLRVDGDLLLVELASGAIVDILYDFYY